LGYKAKCFAFAHAPHALMITAARHEVHVHTVPGVASASELVGVIADLTPSGSTMAGICPCPGKQELLASKSLE
jgi:hypothetical protein